MRYRIVLLVLTALISIAAFHGLSTEERPNAQLWINGQEITVEIANTTSERRRGLMNRETLSKNHGMLFTYPDEKERSFWMKNTYIPLDIIFVDANNTIVDTDEADPEPDRSDENLKRYRSDRPAKYVIEVNQGFSRKHNITEGSEVIFGEEITACCIN